MSSDENVTTFSGFGSWMSTLTPATGTQSSVIHELPAEIPQRPHVNHHIAELPAGVIDTRLPPPPNLLPLPGPRPEPPKRKDADRNLFAPDCEIGEPVAQPEPVAKLVLKGLQKLNTTGFFEDVIHLSLFCSLSQVNEILVKKGYKPPVGFKWSAPGFASRTDALPITIPVKSPEGIAEWPALVTDGPSCYDPQQGFRINRKESFTAYLSRLQVQVRCSDSQLVINDDLRIGFCRTLRIPEDGRTHNLPAEFGLFPLQNVAAYSTKLRKSNNPSLADMAKKSGVFFTMYQREAMWISFRVSQKEPISEYAIRVFAGGINVVSGRKWDDPEPLPKRKQDYIVVPPQEHLDGIAVGSDTVMQFVAMPIGSGYSIEKQMTGKEDVGGLQLEVIPTTSKLAVQFNPGCDVGYEWLPDPSVASAEYYDISSATDIFIVQDGIGKVRIAGKPQNRRHVHLREIIGGDLKHAAYPITALYNTKLKITVQSRFSKQTVTTEEFSPFAKVREVARTTTLSGKDISSYEFHLDSRALDQNSTLVEAGIVGSEESVLRGARLPELTAKKSDRNAQPVAQQDYIDSYRPTKHRFRSLFGRRTKEVLLPGRNHLPDTQSLSYAPRTSSAPVDPRQLNYGYAAPSPVELGSAYQSASMVCQAGQSLQLPKAEPPHQQQLVEDAWTMGISSGGRLRQQILPDTDIHRPSRWNKSATSMISVQVLNSVAFEAITGMLTPPTPVTLQSYLSAGIPFFNSYIGGQAAQTSGATNFHAIKSVSEIDDSLGVEEGVSVAATQRVACSSCNKNLCDCILRPCNHAFCSACVYSRMTGHGKMIICRECHSSATRILGFSAPMSLPGEEALVPKDVPVVVLPGIKGKFGFMAELW